MFTIRVISYVGDLDDADDIIVIGPYDTQAARDTELERLANMRGLSGMFEFERSDIPVGLASVTSVDAAKVAAMPSTANDDALSEIIWGA